MQKTFTLRKLYLTIMSIVGFIGALIRYGVVLYTLISTALITDDEYVFQNAYRLDACEYSDPNKPIPTETGTGTQRTQEEIDQCKEKAKNDAIMQRRLNYKQDLISGLVWGSLFLIAFLLHFPAFLRQSKGDEIVS